MKASRGSTPAASRMARAKARASSRPVADRGRHAVGLIDLDARLIVKTTGGNRTPDVEVVFGDLGVVVAVDEVVCGGHVAPSTAVAGPLYACRATPPDGTPPGTS